MPKLFAKLLVLLFFAGPLFAQKNAVLPVTSQQLEETKKENNLSAWIYLRLDYVYPEPIKRLPFLLETQQKIWRQPRSSEEKAAWLLLLSTQGYYQLQAGNIMASINCYEAAHKYYTANNTIDFDVAEYIYKPLSNNYTRLGDYERAIYVQQSILKFAEKTGKNELIAPTRGNLAIAYRSMGEFNKALNQVNEGFKTTTPDAENGIMLNNIKADILFDIEKYTEAGSVITSNIKIQLKHKADAETAYSLFGSYVTLGNVRFKTSDLTSARLAYTNALSLLDKYYANERQRERANIFNQLGKIYLTQKKPDIAISYFNRSLKIFGVTGENNAIRPEKIYGDNNVIDALYNRALARLQLKEPDKALDEIWYALVAADKIRLELADEKTRQRFQGDTKTIAERAIEIAYGQYKITGKQVYARAVLYIAEQSKTRTLWDAIRKNQQQAILKNKDPLLAKKQLLERTIVFNERQQILNPGDTVSNDNSLYELSLVDRELRQKYPAFRDDLSYERRLPASKMPEPGQHVLEYFAGDSSIYSIHVLGQEIVTIIKITNAKKTKAYLTNYVDTYFNRGADAMLNDPKTFYQASFNIYKTIVPASLSNVKAYTIIPDGVIGYLSFDGLVTDSNYKESISKWPYLIKKTTISYAFSLQTLLKRNIPPAADAGFTGFFISHQNGNAYLPAVKEEAAAIDKAIQGRFLYENDANSANLFKAINNSRILHLSTHAWLYGPQQTPALDMADQKVFLFELIAKDHAPNLVVLSACQTANGALQNGEGIISFSRGFTAMGAQGTVAGLWNLNDAAAAEIMTQFYKNLSVGLSVSAALHKAKLSQLNKEKNSEAMYLPYYWNALVYMGSDQHLVLKPGTKYMPYLVSILILLSVISAAVFAWKKVKAKK